MALHGEEKEVCSIQFIIFFFVSAVESVDQQTTDESKSGETSEISKEQAEEPMDEN